MASRFALSVTIRVLLALMALLGAISSGTAQEAHSRPGTPTRIFDGFVVNLTLSPKAKETLTARKETIVVFGYFYGAPQKETPRKYVDDMGEVWVGNLDQAEIHVGEDATFTKVKLDSQALNRIDAQGPLLLINVVSGRRSSKDNLLSCGIYEGPFAKVTGRAIPITCKLITEEYPGTVSPK